MLHSYFALKSHPAGVTQMRLGRWLVPAPAFEDATMAVLDLGLLKFGGSVTSARSCVQRLEP